MFPYIIIVTLSFKTLLLFVYRLIIRLHLKVKHLQQFSFKFKEFIVQNAHYVKDPSK